MRAVAVFASSAPDEIMSSNDAFREVQQQARAGLGAMFSGASSFASPVGRAMRDNQDLFLGGAGWSRHFVDPGTSEGNADAAHGVRSHEGHWAPGGLGDFAAAKSILFLVSHEDSRDEFVKECLHCMDPKVGEKIRRPLGETVHGRRPSEVLRFDYLYVGDSGPLGNDGLDEGDGFKYITVILDDLSNFMWLEPTESFTAASTAKHLLRWCKTLGVPEVCMSDTASHFKNGVIKTLEGVLRAEHRFAVATSPWSNGTCERMVRAVVRALKAILQEERRDIQTKAAW